PIMDLLEQMTTEYTPLFEKPQQFGFGIMDRLRACFRTFFEKEDRYFVIPESSSFELKVSHLPMDGPTVYCRHEVAVADGLPGFKLCNTRCSTASQRVVSGSTTTRSPWNGTKNRGTHANVERSFQRYECPAPYRAPRTDLSRLDTPLFVMKPSTLRREAWIPESRPRLPGSLEALALGWETSAPQRATLTLRPETSTFWLKTLTPQQKIFTPLRGTFRHSDGFPSSQSYIYRPTGLDRDSISETESLFVSGPHYDEPVRLPPQQFQDMLAKPKPSDNYIPHSAASRQEPVKSYP
ncbi:hypothetical protein BV898_20320, partial [Hypsibius exemplaris]